MSNEEDLHLEGKRIQGLSDELGELFEEQHQRAERLDDLQKEIEELAAESGVAMEAPDVSAEDRPARIIAPYDLAAAVGALDEETRSRLDREFLESAPAVPPMDDLDRFITITVGCLAALSDFVLVGLPPKTRWTSSKSLEGSLVPVGLVSKLVKEWTVDSDNWLARLCLVPYDKINLKEQGIFLPPVDHRILTFGHDPSPLGFLVGIIDIARWSLTGTDMDGNLISVPIDNPPGDFRTRICIAPLLWLGHLVSDVATSQGIPMPGSSIFRLCRFRMPGAPDEATVSDVIRKLYEQGYDFRQYMVGKMMVSGMVEGLIRLYDWMRFMDSDAVERDGIRAKLAENYVADAGKNARLASRLFWAHAIAAGANAGRITLQAAATQDFFSAARNVNLAEWRLFTVRTIEYVMALSRETDLDQALANRGKIEERWDALLAPGSSARALYLEPPEGMRFEKVNL